MNKETEKQAERWRNLVETLKVFAVIGFILLVGVFVISTLTRLDRIEEQQDHNSRKIISALNTIYDLETHSHKEAKP